MASVNAKKLLGPEVYLQKHSLATYIQDAVAVLLQRKDDSKSLDVLAEYFASVKAGTHVAFREYAYMCATPYNRVSFLKLFWRTYAQMALKGTAMNVRDYLSFLRLLCPDFPDVMIDRLPQSLKTNVLSFSDFLYAFEVVLCYKRFLERCQVLHIAIQDGRSLQELIESFASEGHCHSSIATLSEDVRGSALAAQHHVVETAIFGRAVTELVSNHSNEGESCQCCPSARALEEVFSGCQQLSYDQFVLKLCTSDCVRSEIGVLPPRSRFLSASLAMH